MSTPQRFNIYLPADLARDLAEFKGAINVSAVCAAALRAAVGVHQAHRLGLASDPSRRAAAVARLRSEFQLDQHGDYDKGREAGLTWAVETATRMDLMAVEEIVRIIKTRREVDREELRKDRIPAVLAMFSKLAPESEAWWDGFVNAVSEFWAEVRSEVEHQDAQSG